MSFCYCNFRSREIVILQGNRKTQVNWNRVNLSQTPTVIRTPSYHFALKALVDVYLQIISSIGYGTGSPLRHFEFVMMPPVKLAWLELRLGFFKNQHSRVGFKLRLGTTHPTFGFAVRLLTLTLLPDLMNRSLIYIRETGERKDGSRIGTSRLA